MLKEKNENIENRLLSDKKCCFSLKTEEARIQGCSQEEELYQLHKNLIWFTLTKKVSDFKSSSVYKKRDPT